MSRFYARFRRQGWCFLWLAALVGCAPAQFTTLTIYETPQTFVRLEVDRMIGQGDEHSHPANISTEQMASVLRGIIVQEPLTRLPLYDDLSVPRRHPAFNEDAVMFWAPLLSQALHKSTPEEVVTFYQSRRLSGVKREVTSGGMFVDGDELHVILSNLRSETSYAADSGIADMQDDRLTPMRSIAPQPGQLLFSPESASRNAAPGGMNRIFHEDRRELIVLYKTIPAVPPNPSAHTLPDPAIIPVRPR